MNVLLVDDDPAIRLLVGHLLRAAGHDVVEAEDTASAHAALGAGAHDLLLMDVMLGSEDGIAAAADLLRTAAAPPRLIFLTASTRPEQLEQMNLLGAAGVLHKPFDPMTLLQRLDAILGAP